MNNLDQILAEIAKEADLQIQRIKEENEQKMALIRKESKEEAEKEAAVILKKAESRAAQIRQNGTLSADTLIKKEKLKAKSEWILSIIDRAYQKLLGLSDAEYSALLLSLIECFSEDGNGTVFLAARDAARDRAGFAASLAALNTKKKTLSLSDTPRTDIQSGCVISYGKIEINLSLEALFEAKKDDLKDRLYAALFQGE